MRRIRYLVAYDIRDQRRLRRVHEIAMAFGSPLQYSVFVCDLTPGELVEMRLSLRSEMNLAQDSVLLVPLGDGYDPKSFEFIGVAPSLPTGGAIVI